MENSSKYPTVDRVDFVPFIDLRLPDAPEKIAAAFKDCGFLMVCSSSLSCHQRDAALEACRTLLTDPAEIVKVHPTDPKRYKMMSRVDFEIPDARATTLPTNRSGLSHDPYATLSSYWSTLQLVKRELLQSLAMGLSLDARYFIDKHSSDNDSIRLLQYPASPGAGNRCKEHSDYGSVTLLTTDGTAGLEIWDDCTGIWMPVSVPAECVSDGLAVLIVNAGSLLSSWTKGEVRATLHRVAGPASLNSGTSKDLLREAASVDRYSIAFFVDPDPGVELRNIGDDSAGFLEGVNNIAEYIQWRCRSNRDGVTFMPAEASRTAVSIAQE